MTPTNQPDSQAGDELDDIVNVSYGKATMLQQTPYIEAEIKRQTKVAIKALDFDEAKARLERLISQEAARLAESVIGEDDIDPSNKYEDFNAKNQTRDELRAEQRQRLADVTKGQA